MPVINGNVYPVRPDIPALVSTNTTSYTNDDATLTDIPASFPNVPPYPNPAGGSPVPFLRPVGFADNEAWRLYLGKGFAVALDRAAFAARGIDGLEPDASKNPANLAFGRGMAGDENIWWASQGVWGPTLAKYASRFLAGQPLFAQAEFPLPASATPTSTVPVADARTAQLADIRRTTDAEIAANIALYGRPGVPDDKIVAYGSVTLAGIIWGAKAAANVNGQRIWPGSPRIYPEAQGAEGYGTGEIFPPPAGYIRLVSDWTGFEFQSSKPNQTVPVGGRSYYEPPPRTWRNGQPAPPAYSHPNPPLYFGPVGSYSGLNPETGGTLDADPNRDNPNPNTGAEIPPGPPAPPAPAPNPVATLPAPSPDDSLSAPVGGSNPGGAVIAVDARTRDPRQDGPGLVNVIADPLPATARPAGAAADEKPPQWLYWAGGGLLLALVASVIASRRRSS